MATVALIPAYKPGMSLVDVLVGLRGHDIRAVVVDDGSGEKYRGLFRRITRMATVLSYDTNRGKGHALKTGLRYILDHYPANTVVVTVDADGQHRPEDALRCASEARQNPHALVLGRRDFDGEEVPLRSKLGNKVTRAVFGLMSGRWLGDTQTGMRAFTADLISFFASVGGERYEYEMNVLFACPEHEVTIREVAIQTIYQNNNACSHFRPVRDSLLVYAGFVKFFLASFASFLIDFSLFGILSLALTGLGSWGVLAANLLARIVSATTNFLLNHNVVFCSKEPMARTAARYALCALGIISANSTVLVVLVNVAGIASLPAKLAVEIASFVGSWILQNRLVFQGRKAR